jgi:putative ABC transport system substrate-binding protein
VKRREFIAALGGPAAWPLAARTQQTAMPVIGFLSGASPGPYAPFVSAFHNGLKEIGYVEGQDVAIEYRWAEGHYDRLPALAVDLVRRQVAAMAATTTPAALAAKAATTTIPIEFSAGADPVAIGLVASLNQPGGNATDANNYINVLGAKRLELLRELVPTAAVIGVLVNPNFPDAESQLKDVMDAARIFGQEVHVVNASSEADFNDAFATLVQLKAGALFVSADTLFNSRRVQLVRLVAHHKIPAIYGQREFVLAGGLMSYAPRLADAYRQVGIYIGRILKGAKPGDLPVVQPTKFEFVINLQTARALGIEVPNSLQLLADEVIE